jgi:hypothetical protein
MEVDYQAKYEKLREQYRDLSEDYGLALAKLEGNDYAVGARRETKIDRQRKALQLLNRRVRVQRLQLRRLNELERGLRSEEWAALKEEFAHELAEDDWDID